MGAPERTVERERGRISRFGWGSRLLAKQDLEGTWAGSRRTAARRPLLAKVDFAPDWRDHQACIAAVLVSAPAAPRRGDRHRSPQPACRRPLDPAEPLQR